MHVNDWEQLFEEVGYLGDYYWFIANYNPGVMEYGDIPISFSFDLQSNPARGKAVFNLALPQDDFVTLQGASGAKQSHKALKKRDCRAPFSRSQ